MRDPRGHQIEHAALRRDQFSVERCESLERGIVDVGDEARLRVEDFSGCGSVR
jgi:hypothetical protein